MKQFLLQFFTWWNGQTLGTRFYTWRKGRPVGEDAFGNRYYSDAAGKRRWVIYNGVAEASAHHARLARVDAPSHRRRADDLPRPRMGTAAAAEPYRHAAGLSPAGVGAAPSPDNAGAGARLRGVDAVISAAALSVQPGMREGGQRPPLFAPS